VDPISGVDSAACVDGSAAVACRSLEYVLGAGRTHSLDGAVVHVGAGLYQLEEELVVDQVSALAVYSEVGAAQLRAPPLDSGLLVGGLRVSNSEEVRVDGLRLGGFASGAVWLDSCRECVLRDLEVHDISAAGVDLGVLEDALAPGERLPSLSAVTVQQSEGVLLERVVVRRVAQVDQSGDLTLYGAGLVVTQSSGVVVRECDFSDLRSGTAANLLFADSQLQVDSLLVRNCTARGVAGLLLVRCNCTATDLRLLENRALGVGGALAVVGGFLDLSDSLLSDNSAEVFASGLALSQGARVLASGVRVLQNRVLSTVGQISQGGELFPVGRGGGVSLLGSGTSLHLVDSLVQANVALLGGGVYLGPETVLSGDHSSIIDNAATQGSALYLDTDSEVTFPNGNLIEGW
jgi:hypothetical protein